MEFLGWLFLTHCFYETEFAEVSSYPHMLLLIRRSSLQTMCVGGGGAYIVLGFAVLFKTKDMVFTILKNF